jgi:hypothetical protein
MLGAQFAFRKGEHSGLAAAACKTDLDDASALAQRLASVVAGKLPGGR